MSRSARLNLAIGLPLRNQDSLDALVRDVADPTSPSYRAYVTSEQFAERFGPTESDYNSLIAFAESQGLTVTATHPNRMILDVSGSVASVENAFHVEMVAWSDNTRGAFFAPDRDPSLDLDVPVLDITGLDNYVVPRPMNVKARPLSERSTWAATGSGPGGLLIGSDYRAAYAPGVKLTGTGQTIGLFELDGFYAADVAANFKTAGLPAVPVQTVLLNGSSGAAGNANIEVMLDIMMAAYMAPGATKIVVYEGNNWNDILNRMATDNSASQLSCSWGFSPINATTEQIFRQMIAQGQSFFQASGDNGAYSGAIMSPSDDPNVTVVGGTHLNTSGPGGSWLSETVWSGSGGGVSKAYAIPSWQQGAKTTAAGGSSTMRNIPDVAMLADVQIYLIQNNGQAVSVGGTSAAAPLWAGFMALANQSALAGGMGPVGFLNPAVYAIGEGSAGNVDLHDIVVGSNNGYSAAAGFDLSTGWGSPAGQALIDQLAGTKNSPSFSLTSGSGSVSVTPGSTASLPIGILAQNGFTGSVVLTVTGLPAGVTATFSSTALTLTAASSAAPGTYPLTVTGKSGALTASLTLSAIVAPASGFSLSASPASLGMAQGSTAKSTVTVTSTGSFSGTVALTASGLPSGVTAAFTRGATAAANSLTLTASNTAAIGTSTVTVTGTSGSLTQKTSVTLTVTAASSFGLAVTPAALSIAQNSTATGSVAVTPQNGFTGTVSLAFSGLPGGVTGAFTQTGFTLSANATATPGTSTVTVTGSSGTLTKSATFTLTVVAPPSFTLSTGASSVTVSAGSSESALVTVTPQNGFTGKVTLTVSGLPAGVTATFGALPAANTYGVTFAAASSAAAGTNVVRIAGASGSLSATANLNLSVVKPADFSLSVAPGSLTVFQGAGASAIVSVSALNSFTGKVALTASGLPAGLTASFGNTGLLTLTASKTAAKATATVTITGASGTLSHTTTLSVTIGTPATGNVTVDLSGVANVAGIAIDGTQFLTGGLDNGGRAYPASLLSGALTVAGTSFTILPASVMNTVSSGSVSLPAGQYTTLKLLAAGVNGNQINQSFTVTYTDGTKTVIKQSLSDWFAPQNYAGETSALVVPYRDNSNGTIDGRPFQLYEYSLALAPAKTVSSLMLPSNRNVVIVAATLTR
jgi:subtilase family serine protease